MFCSDYPDYPDILIALAVTASTLRVSLVDIGAYHHNIYISYE